MVSHKNVSLCFYNCSTILNLSYKFVLTFVALLFVSNSYAQLFTTDLDAEYSFISSNKNKLWQKDSSSLAAVFNKLWEFEKKDTGKVSILHIGDSHIQAGFFTESIRNNLHHAFSCGTQERALLFPYSLAHTNGPLNYGVKYTGDWYACKSAKEDGPKGIAALSAYTLSDTSTVKIYAPNPQKESYCFDEVQVFYQNDSNNYKLNVSAHNSELNRESTDSSKRSITFQFNDLSDTLYLELIKDSSKTKAPFYLMGLSLRNNLPGISYSEMGKNGAKVKSFLNNPNFIPQLNAYHPDLVVVSLGTNDVFQKDFDRDLFFEQYDSLIWNVKIAAPKANIILSTPPDFKKHKLYNVPNIIKARKAILDLAQLYNCAVWDMYGVMGGNNSIDIWYKHQLVAYDKVHFNAKGYALLGQLFSNAFLKAYEDYSAPLRNDTLYLNKGPKWKESIVQFFTYQADEPWLYSNADFWLFFAFVLVVFAFIYDRTKLRSLFLLLFSLYFYYKSSGFYFSILLFSTFVDYWIGNKIYAATLKKHKKWWLALAVTINLLILGIFKYSYFVIDHLNALLGTDYKVLNFFSLGFNQIFGSNYNIHEIFLPVGISFFTFQTISYSVDLYRERIKPARNIIDFGFFVSFFPQLVAGPIVRSNEFIPQIHQKYSLSHQQLSRAILLILGGLIKKVVISDYLSVQLVDRVFDNPSSFTGLENLSAIYAYAIQIYCDFSAYSDIAIALAILLGFSLPDNFNSPYKALNISDFWRRWHMSLSRWLKDYLYISLGGNRKGKLRTYVNLMITMLLGGIWHGAHLKFFYWGMLHGIGLVGHKLFIALFPKLGKNNNFILNLFSGLLTFHFVCFAWLFFRASELSTVSAMLQQIQHHFYLDGAFLQQFIGSYYGVLWVLLLAFTVHFLPKSFWHKASILLQKSSYLGYFIVIVITVLFIYQFKSKDVLPFIYFYF